MKRSNFVFGILCAAAGLICLLIALLSECEIEGILWGLAGAGVGMGAAMIGNYLYWGVGKNKARYSERLNAVKVDSQDELMLKIRDRSGRCAHVLGIVVISISILMFAILDALKIVVDAKTIIWFLSGDLALQIVARIAIFNRILKKY